MDAQDSDRKSGPGEWGEGSGGAVTSGPQAACLTSHWLDGQGRSHALTRNPESYHESPNPCNHAPVGETIRLLMLGKTGTGKSETGNTILGKKVFCTELSFRSVTKGCEIKSAFRGNQRIEVMDTPGLFDTHQTQEEILTTIVQAVASLHPGPHAVLFVIRACGRFTQEEYDAYSRLKAVFDPTITRYVILLFTHGDQLEKERVTFQELTQSMPDNLRAMFEECGNRSVLFNNKTPDNHSQVEALLQQVRKIIACNEGRPYSCPRYSAIGQNLDKEVNMRIQHLERRELRHQTYVQRLEQQARDAKLAAEVAIRKFEETEHQRKRDMEEDKKRMAAKEKELQQKCLQQADVIDKQRREIVRLRREFERRMSARNSLPWNLCQDAENQASGRGGTGLRHTDSRRTWLQGDNTQRPGARPDNMDILATRLITKDDSGFTQELNIVTRHIAPLENPK